MKPNKTGAQGALSPRPEALHSGINQDEFPRLPDTGFVRLPKVLELIPVSETTWWDGVREGRFPAPVKLSARCSAWPVATIQLLIRQLSGTSSMG